MADALARIIVQTKDQASQQFEEIFARINAQYGNSMSVYKKMSLANTEFMQTQRKMAEAGVSITGVTATQTKAHLDLANAAGQNAQKYKELESSTTTAGQGFKLFGMNIVDIAAKFYLLQTSIRAVIQGIEGLFKLAELGAQVQQSDISFARLLKTLDAAPDVMDRLREAAGGLATDYELQSKSAIVLMGTSGELGKQLANNLPQLMEIARAAKIVNPAIRDVDYAYESLTTGIKRGEKRWLDNIGIIFKAEDAYIEYATAIGKSVGELTAEEQQLAYLEKTLRVGEIIKKQAGESTDSLTDKYGILKTELQESKQAFGEFLNEALSPTLIEMTRLLSIVNDHAPTWIAWGEAIAPIIEKAYKLNMQLNPAFIILKAISDLLGPMPEEHREVADSIDTVTEAVAKESDVFALAIEGIENYSDKWRAAADKIVETELDKVNRLLDENEKFGEKIADLELDLNDKLQDIREKADKNRLDTYRKYDDRIVDARESFNDRMIDLERSLMDNLLSENESYAQARMALMQRLTDSLRDFDERRADSIEDVNQDLAESDSDYARDLARVNEDALTDIERARRDYGDDAERLAARLQDIEDQRLDQLLSLERRHIDQRADLQRRMAEVEDDYSTERRRRIEEEIQRDLDALEAKHTAELSMIRDKYVRELDEANIKHAREIEDLETAKQAQIAVIIAAEGAATEKANEESQKRREQAEEDIKKITEAIEKGFKVAWLDALLSVTTEGSQIHEMLEVARLKTMGASDAMLVYRDRLQEAGNTAFGLATIMYQMGLISTLPSIPPPPDWTRHQGRQHGGPVWPGGAFPVGEAGPELFMPKTAGTIIPNNMLGGGTNITISAGAFLGSRADAIRLGNELAPIIARSLKAHGIQIQ